MNENWLSLFLGFFFMIFGSVLIALPNHIYTLILELCKLYCLGHAIYLVHHIFKERKYLDVFYLILSIGFFVILTNHSNFPEWIIRVSFGGYCLLSAVASFVQFIINMRLKVHNIFMGIYFMAYACLGLFLLFKPEFKTDLLMRFFGIYFVVLGFRYFHDWYDTVNRDVKYQWKRKFCLMLPPQICVLLPDWAMKKIQKQIDEGDLVDLEQSKISEEPLLKVMVHVGPEGFQKIGHISFAYKGIVFSYGNYDSKTYHWNQTLGEGVYFNVPLDYYIPNMMEVEHNSIFEYGIYMDESQKNQVESVLESLAANSKRWYCALEEAEGYDCFEEFESDYPSRLHYRTGAKFYKIKKGKFKYYWALGDNCATFTDLVLQALGSDVLSLRGITSPGTYFDYLEKEYAKPYSPIVYRKVHMGSKKAA